MSPLKASFALFTVGDAQSEGLEQSDLMINKNSSRFFDTGGHEFDFRLFPSRSYNANSVESMHTSIKYGLSKIADFVKQRNIEVQTPKGNGFAQFIPLDSCRVHYIANVNDWKASESEQVGNWQTLLYRRSRMDETGGFFPSLREDFQIVQTKSTGYFHLLGLNVLHHRMEMLTLQPVNKMSYYGMLDMQEDTLQIAFFKSRHIRDAIPQEISSIGIHDPNDYEVREFSYFGRANVKSIIIEKLVEVALDTNDLSALIKRDNERRLEAACWLPGHVSQLFLNQQNWTLTGTGKGKICMTELQDVFAEHKRECRKEPCWLDFTHQTMPQADILIVGKMFRAMQVLKILQENIDQNNTSAWPNLHMYKAQIKVIQSFRKQYFAPQSSNVDKMVEAVCSLPLSLYAQLISNEDIFDPTLKNEIEFLCIDLSFLVVIMNQLSLIEKEERNFYGAIGSNRLPVRSHVNLMAKRLPSIAESAITPIKTHADLLKFLNDAWIIGACIFFEFLRQNSDRQFESDFFSAQVGDGLPIGLRLSALLLVAACLFLYYTTRGSYNGIMCPSLYPRSVLQGKARQHDSKLYTSPVKKRRSYPVEKSCQCSTCSIYFLDDARE
uniref:Uncharacterized protein AlNc14C73G4970 n=1 Tax=Albugo laibachii Nc14 TaxID=890382 RepID=F0WEB3_9STRA|nr:conserved hypothetical protein [Albugo laibachii Nc14]|eukprot:CCA19544.1 conserved hypothetical protein [Albugo laibachii Nc14]